MGSVRHGGAGRWREGWNSLVSQGMVRGDLERTFNLVACPFHATLSQSQFDPVQSLCTLLESRPLEENCVLRGCRQGVSDPYLISPEGDLFF